MEAWSDTRTQAATSGKMVYSQVRTMSPLSYRCWQSFLQCGYPGWRWGFERIAGHTQDCGQGDNGEEAVVM